MLLVYVINSMVWSENWDKSHEYCTKDGVKLHEAKLSAIYHPRYVRSVIYLFHSKSC